MGRRKLCTGIILGAVVGGLISLIDKDTRMYAKNKLSTTTNHTKYYLRNPSKAVRNARISFNEFSENFKSGAESTINALEQIEETLDKVIKKKTPVEQIDQQKIE